MKTKINLPNIPASQWISWNLSQRIVTPEYIALSKIGVMIGFLAADKIRVMNLESMNVLWPGYYQ